MAKFRAIHTIELKSDTDRQEFEQFMTEEFLPATVALPGCLQAQFLKGYKGNLPGVAQSQGDYAWISLWEGVEANNAVWSRDGEHHTPESILRTNAKLHHYANFTLVGGFEVVDTQGVEG